MRIKIVATVIGALVAATLASCSAKSSSQPVDTTSTTSTTPAATTTTVDVAAVAQQVLAILTTGNSKVKQDTSISDETTSLKSVSRDFSSTAQQLQALTYPDSAQSDAKALVASLEKLSFDSSQLADTGGGGIQAFQQAIVSDEGAEVAASGALRHDLGLPPVST